MEATNTELPLGNINRSENYKLNKIRDDLLTTPPPGSADKNKKSLRLVFHSENTESSTNSIPLPTTLSLTSCLEGSKSPASINTPASSPIKNLTTFISTPKYIKQYFNDTFKADGFGLDATSITYSLNMRVSRKSSKTKTSKDTQDPSNNSSEIVNSESVKVMKELKFKRRRSPSEANHLDAKEKTSISSQDLKDDDSQEKSHSPDHLNTESPDEKNVKRNPSTPPRQIPPPIETAPPEGDDKKDSVTFKMEIESSNSSSTLSPVTAEGNNFEESLSRSSSIGSNKHCRETIISRKKSIVSKSKKLIKRGTKNPSDMDTAINDITRYAMANPKRNKEYHSFFKTIPQDEHLINDYGCALQKEILAQGRIYVSFRHICFHANIFGWTTNLVMPFSDILNIEKKMTAFVIPNAILITTVKKSKYFFTSFLSRDTAYETFVKLWHNANPRAASKYIEPSEYDEVTFSSTHQREITYDSGDSASGSEGVTENEKSSKTPRGKKFQLTRLILRKYQNTKGETSLIHPSQSSPTNSFHASKSDGPMDEDIGYDSASHDVRPSTLKSLKSIAFVNGQTQKHLETWCDCIKKNQHYDKVMMDTKFTGTIEKIYNLLFTSGFVSEFISKLENNDDTVFGEWATAENGKLVRTASFTKRLNNSIGPKSTKCYLKEECLHRDFDDYVTALLTTETPDVPSGGSFSVKTRTCIMWGGRNKVRVIVTAAVEFSKSTWLKTPIEKGAIEGQLEYYKTLEIAVRKYISQNRSEFHEPEIEEGEDTDSEVATKSHKPRPHAQPQQTASSSSYISPSPRIISRNSSQFNLPYTTRNISQSSLSRRGRTSTGTSSLLQFTTKTMLMAFTSAKLLLKSLFTLPNIKVIIIWTLMISIVVNVYIWARLRDINIKIDKFVDDIMVTDKLQRSGNLQYSVIAREYGIRGRDGRIGSEWNGLYQDDGVFDLDGDKFLEWLEKNVVLRK